MATKKRIKYFISCGAIIYTFLSVLILIFSIAIAEGTSAKILVPSNFLYLLMFSYVLSLGNTFLGATEIATPLRYTLHAICFIIGFFSFIMLCGISFSSSCIMSLVYAIIYCGAMITAHTIKKKLSLDKLPKKQVALPKREKKSNKKTRIQIFSPDYKI